MDAAYRTPVWLSGLIALVVIAFALAFGVMQFMHAKKAALEEQAVSLRAEIKTMRTQDGELQNRVAPDGPLVKNIQAKRKLLEDITTDTDAAKGDIETLVGKIKESAQAIKDGTDKAAAARTQLTQESKDRRTELIEVEKNLLKTERDFETRRDQLRLEVETISQQYDTERKKQLKELALLDTRMSQLADRIQELTRQREIANQEVKSDGKIMEADTAAGFVIVDLGRQQSLRKGLKFTVYNRRAGRNVIKGAIEVTKVEDTIATCRVLEEKEQNDPMVAGDLIANPVFDRDKTKGFAIRGDFTRFSKDELKRFINESGGRYDEELTVATDYLVAGEHAESALIQANKLGISILSEEQLIESQLFRLPSSRASRD